MYTFDDLNLMTSDELFDIQEKTRAQLEMMKQVRYNIIASILFYQSEIEKEKSK